MMVLARGLALLAAVAVLEVVKVFDDVVEAVTDDEVFVDTTDGREYLDIIRK